MLDMANDTDVSAEQRVRAIRDMLGNRAAGLILGEL
jgi:hypothetical protein